MLVSAAVSESYSSIVFSVKELHSIGTDRSPGNCTGCESLQAATKNVALFMYRLDVILEAFLLSTNTPVAYS